MGFVKDAWNGITGKTSAKAAQKAGDIQADASKYAADLSQQQFEQTRQDQLPWLNAGANALGKLQDYTNNNTQYKDPYGNAVNQALGGIGGNLTTGNPYSGIYNSQINNALGGINPNGNINPDTITSGNIAANNSFKVDKFSDKMQGTIDRNYRDGKYTGGLSLDDFQADPSYEFRKQQGMDGIQSSAAASGGLLSGAALKALNNHNSNLASQEYNNAWQRDQAQKQQQYGVDTGLLGQNYNMFADQQNRRLQADITGATMNQQANMFNTSNDLNAQMTNVNNSMAAQQANQNYGLNALQSLMAAKGQDYGIYSDQQDRDMQAQQFNIGNQYNALNALTNARTQDYNMFNNEDARLFNQLANLAGVGQQTATNLGSFGAQNAGTIGDAYINAANAQANGIVGGANAKASGWGNLLNLGMMAGGFI